MDIDHAPSTRNESALFLVFVAELAEFDHDGLSDALSDANGSRRSATIRHTICHKITLREVRASDAENIERILFVLYLLAPPRLEVRTIRM